ncbi:unnamed protein product [Plutella xylostella]|uniref:(diamondback moth) hypothetical protein n=1 Tax=Plutella xylostella TaxID=51655 RepID=A0A8S4GGI5_PLUXY|nr:unnamed protein product [Plutella xylostella]
MLTQKHVWYCTLQQSMHLFLRAIVTSYSRSTEAKHMASASRADIILSPEESSSSSSSSSSSESSASSREASPVRVADPPSSSSAKKSKKRKTEKERKPAAPAKKRSKKENTEKTSKKRDGTTKLKKENQVKAATQLESRPSTSLKTTAKDIMGVDSDIDEDLLNNGAMEKLGGNLTKFKSYKSNTDLVYWDDPNELIERLQLLIASKDAGNTNHDNEILSIIEELKEAGIIKE